MNWRLWTQDWFKLLRVDEFIRDLAVESAFQQRTHSRAGERTRKPSSAKHLGISPALLEGRRSIQLSEGRFFHNLSYYKNRRYVCLWWHGLVTQLQEIVCHSGRAKLLGC